MRDVKINTSLVTLLDVLECTIEKKINEHGMAVISGHIKSNKEEKVMEKLKKGDCFANILITDEEGKEEEVFYGIVQKAETLTVGGLKKITIYMKGSTVLLDCKERTRTFQDKNMTYDTLLSQAEKENDAKHLMRIGRGENIKDIIVQYKETNWQFIKRMASRLGSFVMPYYKGEGIRYYIGLDTTGKAKEIDVMEYSMVSDMEEYLYKKKNNVEGISEKDTISYIVKTRDYADLGESIQFQGRTWYVYKEKSTLDGGELVHTYQLRSKGGFSQVRQYDTQLIGASLEGHILDVKTDKVKVCMNVDGTQDIGTAKWFCYSTIYSSPDGSGWYCMPEKNDRVRLYFPSEKEEEGYIISSIHVGGSASGEKSDSSSSAGGSSGSGSSSAPRTNPDNKSIMNKYNKQLELTPTSITMTNNNGMTIKLDDEEGIYIISDKDVVIEAEENLAIASVTESLSVEAKESIEMIQGDTKITMKEDIVVEGAEVKIQ